MLPAAPGSTLARVPWLFATADKTNACRKNDKDEIHSRDDPRGFPGLRCAAQGRQLWMTRGLSLPPWLQRGNAYVQVFDIPADVARQYVPAEFDIVASKDGFTEGSLYIANYNNQSTLEYNELIFICAQVQYQGNKGGWIHSIYVDNEKAQEAGINVWGLPKKMATFSYDRNTDPNMQHIVVKDKSSATLVVDASFEDKAMKIPFMHQTVASFGVDQHDPSVLYHSETKQKYGVKC